MQNRMILKNQLLRWRALWNPDMYHGWSKDKNYFEGWYLKVVDPLGKVSLAFIPGISFDKEGKRTAFIQVLDGLNAKSHFYAFDAREFNADEKRFSIQVGNNLFSSTEMKVDLPQFTGHLKFENPVPWPANNYGPGVMGWYSFVPFMQCYHGVVSMDHRLEGALNVYEESINFKNGRGYIEKDWGRSFPKAWIWMQTNHFTDAPGTSIMFSIAHIPWLTGAFVGFLAGFLFEGKIYDFTTYNRSKVTIDIEGHGVKIEMKKKNLLLSIHAQQAAGADLKSPLDGAMLGKVNESMNARIHVQFSKDNVLLYEGTGTHAGMEMAGELDALLQI
jgi:hypothetical protein